MLTRYVDMLNAGREAIIISYTSSLSLCLCQFALINASRSHNSPLQLASETLDVSAGVTKTGSTGQRTKLFLLPDRTLVTTM